MSVYDSLRQTETVYRRMANDALYRPAAPSDGFGNITVSMAELDLDVEARAYAVTWRKWEDDGDYPIGCPDYRHRPALIYTVEAARIICGLGPTIDGEPDDAAHQAVLGLLDLAINEVGKGAVR